jgi:hypothetical protein
MKTTRPKEVITIVILITCFISLTFTGNSTHWPHSIPYDQIIVEDDWIEETTADLSALASERHLEMLSEHFPRKQRTSNSRSSNPSSVPILFLLI